MAEVNPQTGQMGTQNYIGYSERRSGNNAWASLFGSVIGAVDANNQSNIESSVNQTVASLDQQFFGMDDIVNSVNGQQPQTATEEPDKVAIPKPVQDGITRIGSLNKAAETGSLSQGNYAAQLEANVRALKAKYPGYTNEIDKAVSRAINAPSANMLRDSIIAERKAKETDRDAELKSFYTDADKYAGMFGPEWMKKITSRSVSPEEMPFVRSMIAEFEADDMMDKRLKLDYELKAAKRTNELNTIEDSEKSSLAFGRNQVQLLGKRMLYSAGGIDDMGYSKFQTEIFEAAKDGNFSKNERDRLMPMMQKLITDVEAFKTDLYYNKGLYANLSDAGKKELDAGFASLIEPFQKALVGNDISGLTAIGLNAAAIKHSNEDAVIRLLNTPQGQQMQDLQAAATVAPVVGQYIGTKLATGGAKGTSLETYITSMITGKMAQEGSPAANHVKNIASNTSPTSSATTSKEVITLGMDVLKDPKSTPQAKANMFKSFFGEGNTDFLRLFDSKPGKDGLSSQQKVYYSLTTPEVKDAIKAMNDPQIMNQYMEWTKQQVFALNKSTIDTAKVFQEFNQYGKVVYDTATRRYGVKLDPSKFSSEQAMRDFMAGGTLVKGKTTATAKDLGFENRPDLVDSQGSRIMGLEDKYDYGNFNAVKRELSNLNVHLSRLVPIMEAAGVKDIDGEISRLTGELDKDVPKQDRYSYYYTAAIEAAKSGADIVKSGAATVGDYLVPDPVANAVTMGAEAVGSTIEGFRQFGEDSSTPITESDVLGDGLIKLDESIAKDIEANPDEVVVMQNKKAQRNLDITPTLKQKLAKATVDVLGPGYKVYVYSGGQHKEGQGQRAEGTSNRHDNEGEGGRAADVYVIAPNGKRVTDRKILDRLVQHWKDKKLGSVGTYMEGMGIHFDEITEDNLRPGQSTSWNY